MASQLDREQNLDIMQRQATDAFLKAIHAKLLLRYAHFFVERGRPSVPTTDYGEYTVVFNLTRPMKFLGWAGVRSHVATVSYAYGAQQEGQWKFQVRDESIWEQKSPETTGSPFSRKRLQAFLRSTVLPNIGL